MSLSKYRYMPSYDFPDEILSDEIFKTLPVKYVLRCLCVQKSWYNLIKSPMFVTLYHNHQKMTASDNPKYLLFHNTNTHLLTVCSDDKQCQEYCKLAYPLDFANHEWFAVSNGLICISSLSYQKPDYDPSIYVWNPVVQTFKILRDSLFSVYTSLDIEWKALAFGYLPEVNDYVIIHALKLEMEVPDTSDTVVIGVYSLNTGSCKIIRQDDFDITWVETDQTVFHNGTVFWVGEDYAADRLVIHFDTKTKILRQISVPDWFSVPESYPVMHPFGHSIAYFVENAEFRQLDIWVLKCDLIDEFSWEKKVSVNLSEHVWADVFGMRTNGEPILAKSNNLISCDLNTHELYDFVNSYDRLTPNSCYEEGSKPPFTIIPFVETLLWLDE